MGSTSSKSGARREQILDEALKLFAEHGLNVSTRQIARAVGISQPSLYAFFRTSEDIAAELCCRGFITLHERLSSASQAGGSPAERLRRIGADYIDFGLSHPAIYRIAFLLDQPAKPSHHGESVLAAGVRAFGVLLALFQEVRGAQDDTTAALAQSAWASMHGLVSLLIVRHEFPWVDRATLIDLHLDRVCEIGFEAKVDR